MLFPAPELCRVRGVSPDCSLLTLSSSGPVSSLPGLAGRQRLRDLRGIPRSSIVLSPWGFTGNLNLVRTRHQTAIKQDQQNVCFREQATAADLGLDFLFFECYCVLFQQKHSVNIWKAEIKRLKGLCRGQSQEFPESRISQCIIFPLRLGAELCRYGGEIVTIASCVCFIDSVLRVSQVTDSIHRTHLLASLSLSQNSDRFGAHIYCNALTLTDIPGGKTNRSRIDFPKSLS